MIFKGGIPKRKGDCGGGGCLVNHHSSLITHHSSLGLGRQLQLHKTRDSAQALFSLSG
jgi:hypothetical protein